MKKKITLTAAAVCVAAIAWAQYAPFNPEWNKPATPHRVIGNVYYVGTNELTSFLIVTPKGHVLIDSGFDESVPLIKDAVAKLGFKYADIKLLLNGQAHFDHAAGLARIKRETGARLEAMGDDAALLERGGRDDFRFGNELTFTPVKVDRVLNDGDTVGIGDVKLTARLTPGHTKGATTFVTVVEENGKTHRVVFATSISVNPGTKLIDNPKYPNILADWDKTYRVLNSLTPDVWVSSHAGFFDMAGKSAKAGQQPNPYIDPQGYKRYVANGQQQFQKLLAEERAKKPSS